ncbi:thioesterase domain-containing protein [Streptomyces sp. NPDC006450]|uniref:thioesterase II family protein n=1 Tax=Streptomyces sp. NPDC006450 TaxID=3155458 RepID=UPI0033B36B7A
MTLATTDAQVWIRRFHQAPATAPRLVCLPHAGGSASYYFPFSAALSPAAQVLAVQYPGRQDRRNDPSLRSVPELAEAVFGALAVETYRCDPGATVSCPISVLTGDADPRTSIEEARDWRQHTGADCAVREFSGGHFFLNDHQPEITEFITRASGWSFLN